MTTTTFDPARHENNMVTRLDRLRTTAGRFPLSLIEFGMRLAVGATFFRSGMNKVESFDTAITLFREEYRLPLLPPELAAYLGTAVELGAPVLLVLGLFARLGAAALLAMTLVIQFLVYPDELARASDVGFDPGLCAEPRARCAVDRPPHRLQSVRT